MDKRFGVFLVAFLVVSLFAVNIGFASAAVGSECVTYLQCSPDEDCSDDGICVLRSPSDEVRAPSASANTPIDSFIDRVGRLLSNVFWGGSDSGELDEADMNALGVITRWLMLFLVIMLFYSGMSMAKFPENSGLRFTIALIVGFLSVIMINNSEFITLLQSYKALGITVSILLPMMALVFITYTVSVSLNSFGILLQRVAWLIYSLFLFLKVGGMLLFKVQSAYISSWFTKPWFINTTEFLFGQKPSVIQSSMAQMNTVILVILLIVAIAVFMWFVMMNASTVRWIAHATQMSDLERYRDKSERSSGKISVDAEQTKK